MGRRTAIFEKLFTKMFLRGGRLWRPVAHLVVYIGMYQGNLEMIFKSTKGVPFEKSEKYSSTIHLTI